MANIRVLATDLEFPEGPVVMPDGSVVLVEIRGKRLTRVYPDGRKEWLRKFPAVRTAALAGWQDVHLQQWRVQLDTHQELQAFFCRKGPQPEDYLGGNDPARRSAVRQGRDRRRQMQRACAEGAERPGIRQAWRLWFSDLGKRRARDMDVGAFYYIKPGMKEIVEGDARPPARQRHRTVAGQGHGLYRRNPDRAAVGHDISSPARVGRDVIYRGQAEPIAGNLAALMFDCSRSGIRQCLRGNADFGLHLGDRRAAPWSSRCRPATASPPTSPSVGPS